MNSPICQCTYTCLLYYALYSRTFPLTHTLILFHKHSSNWHAHTLGFTLMHQLAGMFMPSFIRFYTPTNRHTHNNWHTHTPSRSHSHRPTNRHTHTITGILTHFHAHTLRDSLTGTPIHSYTPTNRHYLIFSYPLSRTH
jgi:hypothetical protein